MDKKSLRILMITPFFSPNIGGVETHLDDLCDYLRKRDYRVFVLTYQPLTTKKSGHRLERHSNIEVRRIKWFGYNWFNMLEPKPILVFVYLFPILYLHSLTFLLRHGKNVDVVHMHGLIAASMGRFLKPLFRKRFVASVHTVYYLGSKPFLGKIFAWVLGSCDKVLFGSKGMKKEFTDSGLREDKTAVFTYWADVKRFKPLDKVKCKERLNWGGKFVVLFVGRLIKEKGVHVLIRAARMVDKNIHFAFITSGSYEEFQRFSRSPLPENIIYVGKVDYSILHNYYNAADLFVLPSPYREGFSRAVVESMLCGTPVIVSKVGSLPEVIRNQTGELVDPPTSEEFAKKIQYYFENPRRLRLMRSNCLRYAKERFSEKNAEIIEEVYQGII
jgi:glycosyltransferase involved in cell wall biosynthesis